MDEYFIGAGALLTAGPKGAIAPATLHAQAEAGVAGRVGAAVIDFEASAVEDISQILVVAAGWSASQFRERVIRRFRERQVCELGEVISVLAGGVWTDHIHVFAHWQLDGATSEVLAAQGITVVPHPLEAIGQVALVTGQRVARWHPASAA